MKRKIAWVLALVFVLAAGGIWLTLAIPLTYASAPLNLPAIDFVKGLQNAGAIEPQECAARYLYFQTDYHAATPQRIRVVTKSLSGSQVRVSLHDPSCRDDSIHSSIDRVYLERNAEGIWIPTRHEWSHKGRGRLGWTTAPTS